MEHLRPEVNWNDCDRVSVLYGPLPNQNLNPDAWSAKVSFWIETVERWLRREKRSTFTIDVLEKEFNFKGRKPNCLRDVLSHLLNDKRVLMKQTNLESKFNLAAARPSASWSNWTLNALKSGVTGLVQIAVGSRDDIREQEKIVHPKILEENSRIFFEKLKGNSNCFKMNKFLFLNSGFVDEIQEFSAPEIELMLKFLKYDGCCDVATLSDGQKFVKIVDKRQAGAHAAFTPQEIALLRLRSCSDELTNSIDEMEQEIQDMKRQVKAALGEGSRTRARQILKKSKRLEAAADKKRFILDNVEQMMTSLESAATNTEMAEIYSIGRIALKDQLKSMKSVDQLEDLVDEIKELITEGETISDVMGSMDGADDQELLDELEDLVKSAEDGHNGRHHDDEIDDGDAEERKLDDELLDRLNRLGVPDSNPINVFKGQDSKNREPAAAV